MLKYVSLALMLSMITGCASSTRMVEAKVPLVESKIEASGDKVPSLYRQFLESNNTETMLTSEESIYFGESYLSALGKQCRNVIYTFNSGVILKRVACADNKIFNDQVRAWYFVPSL